MIVDTCPIDIICVAFDIEAKRFVACETEVYVMLNEDCSVMSEMKVRGQMNVNVLEAVATTELLSIAITLACSWS